MIFIIYVLEISQRVNSRSKLQKSGIHIESSQFNIETCQTSNSRFSV